MRSGNAGHERPQHCLGGVTWRSDPRVFLRLRSAVHGVRTQRPRPATTGYFEGGSMARRIPFLYQRLLAGVIPLCAAAMPACAPAAQPAATTAPAAAKPTTAAAA